MTKQGQDSRLSLPSQEIALYLPPNMKVKPFPFLLFLIFAFEGICIPLILNLKLNTLKEDAWMRNSDIIRVVKMNLNSYRRLPWINAKEIKLGDLLVDVKIIDKVGKMLLVACKIDGEEKDAIDQMDGHSKKNEKKIDLSDFNWLDSILSWSDIQRPHAKKIYPKLIRVQITGYQPTPFQPPRG